MSAVSRAVAVFGDAALLLPASVLLVLYLFALGQRRLSIAWVASLVASAGATVVLKLAFRACGPHLTGLDVVSPSGHASFSAIFYGALAATLGAGRGRPFRLALAAGALALVLLVGVSRVRTGAHSAEEVAIGLAIGAAALCLFLALQRWAGARPVSPVPLAVGFGLVLVLLGGTHFSLEGRIAAAARQIAAVLDVCAAAGPSPSGG